MVFTLAAGRLSGLRHLGKSTFDVSVPVFPTHQRDFDQVFHTAGFVGGTSQSHRTPVTEPDVDGSFLWPDV